MATSSSERVSLDWAVLEISPSTAPTRAQHCSHRQSSFERLDLHSIRDSTNLISTTLTWTFTSHGTRVSSIPQTPYKDQRPQGWPFKFEACGGGFTPFSSYRMCSLTSEWLLVLVSSDCMNARMRASTRVSELACACAGETIPKADVATAQKMLIGIVRLRPR